MTLDALLELLRDCPLVASVQAPEGSPLDDPDSLAKIALASSSQGVKLIRAQGAQNVHAIRSATRLPVIGLVKRSYPGSEVYITPTLREVEELLAAKSEVVAVDATPRVRPGGVTLEALVRRVHAAGKLVLGDCDTIASIEYADLCGCDLVATTLAGYTRESPPSPLPDLELVYRATRTTSRPVLAEGRITDVREAHTALRCGACGFVVGAALNDPVRRTAYFARPLKRADGPVGAVDLGGTWLRFAVFSDAWQMLSCDRIPNPPTREARLSWIREKVSASHVCRVGVSSGGTIRPTDGLVVEAKASIPDHVGTRFDALGAPCLAFNDGIATAWGHACLPQWAGKRVVTLALGTGVGCGFVAGGRIVMDDQGRTLKINDLLADRDKTFEELLGGATLGRTPSQEARDLAQKALGRAIATLRATCLPDAIVLCGAVGMSEWLRIDQDASFGACGLSDASWVSPEVARSPFGEEAGLYGAAALALYPPVEFAPLLESRSHVSSL